VPPLDVLGNQAVQSTARLIANLITCHLLEVLGQRNEQLILGVALDHPKLRKHIVQILFYLRVAALYDSPRQSELDAPLAEELEALGYELFLFGTLFGRLRQVER
jgi:hypothetical protein